MANGGEGFTGGIQKGLKMGIPLAIRKFELDQSQANFNTKMKMMQDRIDREKMEWQEQLKQAKIDRIIENASEAVKAGQKTGDQALIAQANELLESQGLPGAPSTTEEMAGFGGPAFWTEPTPEQTLLIKTAIEGGEELERGKILEGLKQAGRVDLEELKQAGRVDLEAEKYYDKLNLETLKQKYKSETGKEWAPDVELWRNAETGGTQPVDTRDENEMNLARQAGYAPIGPQAKSFLQAEGKIAAGEAAAYRDVAKKARASVVTLTAMDQLLDRFTSGKLKKIEKSLQQYANAFGIPIDTKNLSAKEAFTAITEQLALQSRNQGEGMVLAGQMSDRDVQFLRDMNPQLVISKGGNKLIIKMRKAVAKRQIKSAELASEYQRKRKGIFDPVGFEKYLKDNLKDKSIFGISEGAVYAGTDKQTGLPVYEVNGKYYVPDF